MRFELEASYGELLEKAPDLIKALADKLYPINPELGENLEKALPKKEPELKYKVLQEIHAKTKKAYKERLQLMINDIVGVLDRSVIKKSLNSSYDSQNGFKDVTEYVADKYDVKYKRAKTILKQKGYTEKDFEEGGKFYGRSTNELLDYIRELNASN